MEIRKAWLAGTLAKLGVAFLLGTVLGVLFLMGLFYTALDMWIALVPSLSWVPIPVYVLMERLSSLPTSSRFKDFLLTTSTAAGLAAAALWLELGLSGANITRSDWVLPVWFDVIFTLLIGALIIRPQTRWGTFTAGVVIWTAGGVLAYLLSDPVGVRWHSNQPLVQAVLGLPFLLALSQALYQTEETTTSKVLNAALKWPLKPLYSVLNVWNGPGPNYDA